MVGRRNGREKIKAKRGNQNAGTNFSMRGRENKTEPAKEGEKDMERRGNGKEKSEVKETECKSSISNEGNGRER